jgi:Lon protease-like protein
MADGNPMSAPDDGDMPRPAHDAAGQAVRLPLFPLGTVLFPGMPLPLHLFEERYRKLMREHHDDDPIFGVVLTSQGREVSEEPETHRIGTAASLLGLRQYPDGRFNVAVRGGRRFRILESDWDQAYLTGSVVYLDEPPGDPAAFPEIVRATIRAYRAFVEVLARAAGAEVPDERLDEDPIALSYAISAQLPLNTWEAQRLLELPTTAERLAQVTAILQRERRLLTEAGAAGLALEHPGRRFLPN